MSTVSSDRHAAQDRAHHEVEVARARYQGSWVQDIVTRLKALDFAELTTVFAAELLWSALPFIILLSSLANERIDDDVSRHIGLDHQGARIVTSVFRGSPSHDWFAILTGLLFSFAGVIAVVGSLQVVYERAFDQKPRGWRDLPRRLVWVAVLLAALVIDGAIHKPEHSATGPVGEAVLGFVVAAVFFAWTMHFLLAGRVAWRRLIRPAVFTAILWTALGFFSSIYFSSFLVDDNKTYGAIGVSFTFLTWFVLISGVIIFGAAVGAVWEARRGRFAIHADNQGG
jgi:membrane protein